MNHPGVDMEVSAWDWSADQWLIPHIVGLIGIVVLVIIALVEVFT